MTAAEFSKEVEELANKKNVKIWYRTMEKLVGGQIRFTGLTVGTQKYDGGWKNDKNFKIRVKSVDFWGEALYLIVNKI